MSSRLAVLLTLCCTLIAGAAHAQALPSPTVEYSADRLIESEAGNFSGKVYAARDKERMETTMQGMQSITILRRDQQASYMLMPSHHMYQQTDFAKAKQQSGATPDDVEITEVGPDTIEGRPTTKYKLLMKDHSAGGFIWITQEGIAVKMDTVSKEGGGKQRMTMTLSNLQIGPQDPQLFEVPSDYTAMPSMGKGMGALGALGSMFKGKGH
ncbi:MAG TPA: DUF4412 domain-containing protein [Steroidobacteraceae bacterium]|nr:DUF4412 domain-containing protein [Steroidobacteraceae bacterium]